MDEPRSVEQDFACIGRKPRACMTCALANGEPPWADSPLKSYCIAYPRELGEQKPPDVYYEGADCSEYVEDRNGL